MTEQIPLPEWLPPVVGLEVRKLEREGLFDDERAVLVRVTNDTRMQDVWRELSKRKRKKRSSSRAGDVGSDRGEYLYAAVQPATVRGISADDAQAVAMSGILREAFRLGVERQAASKLEDVEQKKAAIQDDAKSLRRIADELDESIRKLRPYGVHVPESELAQKTHDANALRRIASWKDELAARVRGADDPMTIQNDKVNPIEQGTQTRMASTLEAFFGAHFHGLAAIIAAVALDADRKLSPQVSRSRFSKPATPV